MQVLITHTTLARARVLQFSHTQLAGIGLALAVLMMLASGAAYHYIFVQAAREGWPVVSQIVQWVVRDEVAQRERFMRENLDAMAQKLGEVQAKLVKLEAMGERVSGMAGVPPAELAPLKRGGGGQGGAYVPVAAPTLEQLTQAIERIDLAASQNNDVFTLIESRLLESRLQALMVPSSAPVEGPVGSRFGFRSDPFTGHTALHTGLDFPAEAGTPIQAAAGGMVVSTETHPEYGRMLVIEHGNGLTTRYAHTARIVVKDGDLVRRGQHVADVGSSGRSTGPHLHFEVLVDGVPQNPARFLARADSGSPVKGSRR